MCTSHKTDFATLIFLRVKSVLKRALPLSQKGVGLWPPPRVGLLEVNKVLISCRDSVSRYERALIMEPLRGALKTETAESHF